MEKSHTSKRRNTVIFAALVLLAGLSGLAGQAFFREKGAYAVVSLSGREIARLPLSKDTELLVKDGAQGYNRICVQNGEVWITDANCPDQICMREGKKRLCGEMITCLPHKLTVTVEGADGGADTYAR